MRAAKLFSLRFSRLADKSCMERRREIRHEQNFSARLRLLGPAEQDLAVTVEEMSGAGARLRSLEPVPVSSPVRLEWGDAMFLGECVHSTTAPDGGFVAGIHFDQVLRELQDLGNLMAALLVQSEESAPADQPRRAGEGLTSSLSRRFPTPSLPPEQP